MSVRRFSLIPSLLALPSLTGCGDSGPPPVQPPSAASLMAVSERPGIPRDVLARAIDGLFDADAVGDTRALLVLRGGEVIAQRYGEGYGRHDRFIGWSMSTCLTGIMIGILVSDGRLRLDETAPVPAWQRSGYPRGEITLRQLLQMRSGLRQGGASHSVPDPREAATMLFLEGRDGMSAYAEAQPLAEDPGTTFDYSSIDAIILSDLAARVLTPSDDPDVRRRAVSDFLRTRLLDPAGMTSMAAEFDPVGTMIGSSMVHATARDWARLGEFLRHAGSVKCEQIVPRRWIEFMRRPSQRNPGFGAQLWLNSNRGQNDDGGGDVLFPGKAPSDLFACVGGQGHYLIGSPSQKLTVVRLGHTGEEAKLALRERLGDLVALFPR